MTKQALKAPKLSDKSAFNQYSQEMLRNVSYKAANICARLPQLTETDVVVDIGCCNGELLHQIVSTQPVAQYIGVDLSNDFLELARKNNAAFPQVRFLQADANYLPFSESSVSVFFLSSLLHEVFSYGNDSGQLFSREAVLAFLTQLKKQLQPGGVIIIHDPARPENPHEELLFSMSLTTGIHELEYQELKKYPVRSLSILARYIRFLHEYLPLKFQPELQRRLLEQVVEKHEERLQAPAWIISEFLRHRDLCATDGNWNSEMMEQYGVFSASEFEQVAHELGLNVEVIRAYYNKDNHSVIKNNEIKIWDLQGNPLERANRLPTNLEVVLKK